MMKLVSLARRLPWPLHVLFAFISNGAHSPPDRKVPGKGKRNA
ncbi:hypothetical protein [Novosphingobium sp. B 225]|nr:hypothetical protein [Novosphingobium sp. B 225]